MKEILTQQEFDAIEEDDNTFIMYCQHCERVYVVTLTDEEIDNLVKWNNREMLIQDALPDRTSYEREVIRYNWSGLPMIACCKECEIEFWGEEEE